MNAALTSFADLQALLPVAIHLIARAVLSWLKPKLAPQPTAPVTIINVVRSPGASVNITVP